MLLILRVKYFKWKNWVNNQLKTVGIIIILINNILK